MVVMGRRKDGRFYVKGRKPSQIRSARQIVGKMKYDANSKQLNVLQNYRKYQGATDIRFLERDSFDGSLHFAMNLRGRRVKVWIDSAGQVAEESETHSHRGMQQTEYCPVCKKYLKREDIS